MRFVARELKALQTGYWMYDAFLRNTCVKKVALLWTCGDLRAYVHNIHKILNR